MGHQETHIQQLMENLRGRLLTMAAKAQQAVDDAVIALLDNNLSKADAVVQGDAVLDAQEVELDDLILQILARTQPVACDLRLLLGGVRLIVDLERIGDEAVNVASRASMMQEDFASLSARPWLGELGAHACHLLRDAICSFQTEDTALALHVRGQKDETTQMVVSCFQHTMNALQNKKIDEWYAMHLILITRALERVCGRAVNVAEHAYFIAEGVSIKHTPIEEAKSH